MEDRHTKILITGLIVVGVVGLLIHPVKAYRLVFKKIGWYD